MLALGYYGMGDKDKALKYLAEVKALDNNHQGYVQNSFSPVSSIIP